MMLKIAIAVSMIIDQRHRDSIDSFEMLVLVFKNAKVIVNDKEILMEMINKI
jgi:ribosomal protein L30/L7E